jgi:hypothetical protein
MVLGCCLCYLGREWTFDDLEESTRISVEHTLALSPFILILAKYLFLYDKYAVYPLTAEEAEFHQKEFDEAPSLDECACSIDVTHIGLMRYPFKLMHLHCEHKLEMPTRTYNLKTNHRRKILSTTCGHPGWWNAKTPVLFDDFVCGVKDGKFLSDVEF